MAAARADCARPSASVEGVPRPLTFQAIEAAIRAAWSDETCDEADLHDRSPDNPARGQCGVTSLLLQDLVGGELLEAQVFLPDGTQDGYHYSNRFGLVDVDLTREQFAEDMTVTEPVVVARAVPGPPLRSPERYLLLRERVFATLDLEDSVAGADLPRS